MSQTPMGYKISPILQEHMCRLGSKLTFEEASEELSSMLRIQVNAKQIERLCHCYGEKLDQVDWQEAYSDGIQLNFPGHNQSPVYCMADGSMLLTREEKWKEIKLGRVFSSDSHIDSISKNRGMVTSSIYCAHIGNSDDFWERFSKDIPGNRKLVFICDGSKWLWNYIDDCYPESVQILDFFHCKEHICQFAVEYYKEGNEEKEKFIDQTMGFLMDKKVNQAIENIRQLETCKKDMEKHKEKLLNYLTNNEKRINYGKYIEEGLLIGSGPIESAHRYIIQKRLKLSGQRWTLEGAQQVVNLRVYEKSNKWDQVVSLITNFKQIA